jgi:DNA mismatch repair ATPase MutL
VAAVAVPAQDRLDASLQKSSRDITTLSNQQALPAAKMSMFRAKKLDLGCFVNTRVIRDHTKRKVFEQYETERYDNRTTTIELDATGTKC